MTLNEGRELFIPAKPGKPFLPLRSGGVVTKPYAKHRPGEKDRRAVGSRAEVRVVGDGASREFIARVLTYETVDDYGTVWLPGCFAESLATRMPVVAWAHSWQEPIGRYTEVVRDDGTALELLGKLDDFDAVPRARQAFAQFQSGTLDQFSVGFTRRTWHELVQGAEFPEVDQAKVEAWRAIGGWEVMVKADLDEASPVLVGAVPGTDLLAVRAAGQVPLDDVVELARRVKAGELTQDEAQTVLTLLAGEEAKTLEQVQDELGVTAEEAEAAAAEIAALEAEVDEALSLTRSRW